MKYLFLIFNILISQAGWSIELKPWKDGNLNAWIPLPVKKSLARAKEGCLDIKARLPTYDELIEAIELGLADPKVNNISGKTFATFDWMWASYKSSLVVAPSGKYENTEEDKRHWVACVFVPATLTGAWERIGERNEKHLIVFSGNQFHWSVNGLETHLSQLKILSSEEFQLTSPKGYVSKWTFKLAGEKLYLKAPYEPQFEWHRTYAKKR